MIIAEKCGRNTITRFGTFTVCETKICGETREILQWRKEKVLTSQFLYFQHLCMNAKMTRIVILGLNAKKKNVFVKEIQQEMGNTVEVNYQRCHM